MEPLDIYRGVQPLVIQDIKRITDKMLSDDKYDVAETQAHTHNGLDSVQFPFANLVDAPSYRILQRITLTAAQILKLKTTPLTIVPVPVPSKTTTAKVVVIVEGITGFLSYSGTAYTGVNALEFRYTGAAGAKVTADMGITFLNASANAYSHVAGVVTELVPVANAPIVVCVPVADPGTGNSIITFLIAYRLVAFV